MVDRKHMRDKKCFSPEEICIWLLIVSQLVTHENTTVFVREHNQLYRHAMSEHIHADRRQHKGGINSSGFKSLLNRIPARETTCFQLKMFWNKQKDIQKGLIIQLENGINIEFRLYILQMVS